MVVIFFMVNIQIQTAFHACRLADRQHQDHKMVKGFNASKMVFVLEKRYFYTDTEKEYLLKPKITFLPLRGQIHLEVFTFRGQSLNIDSFKFWVILWLFRNWEGTGWNKESAEFESPSIGKKGWGQYCCVSLWSISRKRSHHHVNFCNSPFSPLFSITSLVTPRFIKMLQRCLDNQCCVAETVNEWSL